MMLSLSACSLQAVNSLDNTAPWTRHSIDANESLGVDPFVLSDYYLRPVKSAIRGAAARGTCSKPRSLEDSKPVSYTHLTLPTKA